MGTMLLLLAVALCAGNDPSADDLIARGKAALAAGKYPEAVAQLKKALAADRYNSVALFTLADLYVHQLPDQKLHDEYWKRYSAASIMGLGEAAALEGDTGGAAARYREALRLTPDDPGLHERLGMVLAQPRRRGGGDSPGTLHAGGGVPQRGQA
ncbi:MAG: hypothetical protein NT045_06615 [Candidatus Aureabacteria bacterium]|nr:hypothetical protein [Candidatus Auribacterota bacterium]